MKNLLRVGAKGVFAAADIFSSRMPGPRILIYHQIEAGLGRQMEVTAADFRAQVGWMENNGRIESLETAIDTRHHADSTEVFVLTFDDGYRDMYDRAWPLLSSHRIPFVLYLTTAPVEDQRALTPGGGAEPLTWSQVNEMLESGLMTLGAHTHTHRDLRHLSNDEINAEIEKSNELILKRTGTEPRHFAYPWGYWSNESDSIVRRSYASSVLGSGPPIGGDTDRYLLNRVPVQLSDGMTFFKRKMTTGMRLEDRARRLLTKYEGP